MSFVMNSFKYGVFVVNLIFFILGIILCYNSYNSLNDQLIEINSVNTTFAYLCLFISIIVIIISFLGFCGICYENPYMIKSYALLILICIVLQISVFIVLSRINTDEIGDDIKEKYLKDFEKNSPKTKEFINNLQSNNKCCGVDAPTDYKGKPDTYPLSCCELRDGEKKCNESNIFNTGCKSVLKDIFESSKHTFYIVLGIILGIQLLIAIGSCVLSKQIKEKFNVA